VLEIFGDQLSQLRLRFGIGQASGMTEALVGLIA